VLDVPYPINKCGQANTTFAGVNPPPSPFTSCIGFTLCRRPILSWVSTVPFREITAWTRSEDHPLMHFQLSCEQVNLVLQSIGNHPVRTPFRVEIRPLEAFRPYLVSVDLSDPPSLADGFTSSSKRTSRCAALFG
jgi:hypothetical protein